MISALQKYIEYVAHFVQAVKLYTTLQTSYSFLQFEKKIMDSSSVRLSLIDCLLLPVQRILRIKLLFMKLKDMTSLEHVDREQILVAHHAIETIYEQILKQKKINENSSEVLRIQESLRNCPMELAIRSRKFHKEGLLLSRTPTTNLKSRLYDKLFIFLFSDLLILSKHKELGNGKVEYYFVESLPLDTIATIDDIAPDKTMFEITVINSPKKYLFNAPSVKDKNDWMQEIKNALKQLTLQEDGPKSRTDRSLSSMMDDELQSIEESEHKHVSRLFPDEEGFF